MSMNLGAPIQHLLVDLDGTLLGNRSLALSVDFARQALGKLKPYGGFRRAAKVLLDIKREFGHPTSERANDIRVVELFSKRLKIPVDEGRRILREGVLGIFPDLEKHFYPMPGAKDFLDWAKDHYKLTLATNPVWPIEVIELRVRWAGIDPRIFSNITHIRQMRACKPAPQYYEQILLHGKLNAEDCLLIGNDVKMDLPATRVGIRVFIVGRHKEITTLKYPEARAHGWKGSYAGLRKLLEKQGNPLDV